MVHLEDVDVLVHELGLVALGYAFNLFAESVAWSRIDRSEIVVILITRHLMVPGSAYLCNPLTPLSSACCQVVPLVYA